MQESQTWESLSSMTAAVLRNGAKQTFLWRRRIPGPLLPNAPTILIRGQQPGHLEPCGAVLYAFGDAEENEAPTISKVHFT